VIKLLLPRIGLACLLALFIEATAASFRVINYSPVLMATVGFVLAAVCAASFWAQIRAYSRAQRKITVLGRHSKKLVDEAHAFVISRIVELRRPLQGLVGIQDLFSSDRSAKSAREYFEIADFCSRYLIRQMERIQVFSELERRTLRFEKAEASLRSIVGSAIAISQSQIDSKKIKVVEDWSPEIPEKMLAHGSAIKHILVELLDNSMQYGGGRNVNLRISPGARNSNQFCIHISDAGPGLSEAQLASLQMPLSTLERAVPWSKSRNGLGHILVKKIAEKIGATISVDSRKGGGTSFSLVFSGEEVAVPTTIKERKSVRGPLKILIVDDEIVTRQVVSAMVTTLGFKPETAINGHDAIARAQRDHYDLIFMDVEMPMLDGISAAKIILNELHLTELPHIAILTSHCTQEDRDKIESVGVTQFLSKPASREDIKRAIDMAYEKIDENIALALEAEEIVKSDDERVDDLGEAAAVEPGYLINFNKLYTSLGENISMCRQVLFNASETFTTESEILAEALSRGQFVKAKSILHKLHGEAGVIMCEPLVSVLIRMQDVLKTENMKKIKAEHVLLSEVISNVLSEIEGLNQPVLQVA
jgi:signal transduction histidine kinase/DNA-binding response OmpR family regulator